MKGWIFFYLRCVIYLMHPLDQIRAIFYFFPSEGYMNFISAYAVL